MGSWLAAHYPWLAGSWRSKCLSQRCGEYWGCAVMRRTFLFFQESDIKWASRWDTYLTMSDVQIHWFSIINSVVVVFFLSGE